MEFIVFDPKEFSFDEWATKIREFLKTEQLKFKEDDGELYYQGDDIAAAWDEHSLLFRVRGDQGGLIELRDADRHFYAFTDDLDLFEDKEVKDAVGMQSRTAGALYGFSWQNEKKCRFHLGPSRNFHYFYDEEEADYPPILDLEDVWALFFRTVQWIGDSIGRIQDLKGIHADDLGLDVEVDLSFKNLSGLDGLSELLADEDGLDRGKGLLRTTFRGRDVGWLRRFVSCLPTDPDEYENAFVRAFWRGNVGGTPTEVFYVGVERRNLRPFVQMPVHRTTKELVDRFKAFFKGHRFERQEYYL